MDALGWGGGGFTSSRRFLRAPKTGVKIEIDGWDSFSSLPSWRVVNEKKTVIDAYGGRLLGDGSFEHPGQMLKWMVLRVSPILYTLFDH